MVSLPALEALQLGGEFPQQASYQQILIHLALFLIAGPVCDGAPLNTAIKKGRYYTPTPQWLPCYRHLHTLHHRLWLSGAAPL
jgi:hypothetical protein